MTRLQSARAHISNPMALDEYKTRMGGYLDAALSLLGAVGEDALENLRLYPDDERTKQVVLQLAAATQALEPLVRLLCPLTAQVPAQFVATPQEVAGHG